MGQRDQEHISVLLEQSVEALNISANPHGIYIDATYGRGGHSRLILDKLGVHGKLLAIDQDPRAIANAQELANSDPRVIVCQGNFSKLKQYVADNNFSKIDGILFDLGVSSPQLDNADRGFSFNKDGPLDMRMDNSENSCCKFTAEEWINSAKEQEIADVLWLYGEERFSRRIAKAIVSARLEYRLVTTLQLAEVIKKAHPNWSKNKHPATQSFLAIRLFINQELEVLTSALDESMAILATSGRLAVISFHSLEDRIVKNFFNKNSKVLLDDNNILSKLPLTDQELENSNYQQKPRLKIVQKPIKAGIIEGDKNIRARSAILRVASKL